MSFFTLLITFILLNVICDLNYFVRTLFCVLTGRIYQCNNTLKDVTTIYGMCTFQNCDVTFKNIRIAKLVRELDFARYHFYDRTGIYQRSQKFRIKSLQGCTLIITSEPVPMFQTYKINTKLVYWDDRSLFLEHEVVTLRDGKVRHLLVSRQHAIGPNGNSIAILLKDLVGSESKPSCPDYITHWLHSMELSSLRLRNAHHMQN
ncbi:protein THEM6-like [Manduca sexta]|uniref:Protein THEM6 n=1 Tax=Manduca sexta TaxID=7130 RepID=A0A921YW81_MANSE|nr:protein THEM6-like [Manduca sexta]KAG6446445.1 hypothetical protein O3G_MSEX004415 [Manduca sexta]UXP72058.1 esterase [Manduca sexta]